MDSTVGKRIEERERTGERGGGEESRFFLLF
jgi:hypothetical protein